METGRAGRALTGVSWREPEVLCGLLEGPQRALAEAWCPANVMQFSEKQTGLFRPG